MVSFIIINYLQKNYTEACVKSILDTIKSYVYEIIVVNNSPEDKLSFAGNSKVKVIENKNLGFSQANNIGAKSAGGEYLLILNSDTLIRNDFLSDLVNTFDKINFGVIGLKLYNPDGTFQLSVLNDVDFLGELKNKKAEKEFKNRNINYINGKEKSLDNNSEVKFVSGAAMFIKKDIYSLCGGFDERFFLFYEDVDLCKRINNRGFGVYFYSGSEIVHYKGENVNNKFSEHTYYYSKKSQLLYYKLHYCRGYY